jgi:HigB_toxin, RelE-like toxic component of a toxin-antitoxin system
VSHHSEAFVAFDTSKLRNAVAIAESGRSGEVRFLGEIDKGINAARSQCDAWLAIAGQAVWRNLQDVKWSHPKASILKSGRVVFNIKGNDYR